MNQAQRWFGYVITDRELLAVRRIGDRYGHLEVSRPILWGPGIAVASFCLHLMAATDEGGLGSIAFRPAHSPRSSPWVWPHFYIILP